MINMKLRVHGLTQLTYDSLVLGKSLVVPEI